MISTLAELTVLLICPKKGQLMDIYISINYYYLIGSVILLGLKLFSLSMLPTLYIDVESALRITFSFDFRWGTSLTKLFSIPET